MLDMSPPINDAALVCGIIGTLLAIFPQLVPQMGLAYRPLGAKAISGMCPAGQLPLWAVALVHFLGFTMFWAGQFVASIQSDREGTNNHKLVVGMMVTALLGYITANMFLHYWVIHRTRRPGKPHEAHPYSKETVPDNLWFSMGTEARIVVRKKTIVTLVTVAIALVIMTYYATAAHTSDHPTLVVFGYLLWYGGWISMVMVRFRIADDKWTELSYYIMSAVFWVVGSGVCLWAMTTATSEGQ